MSTAAVRLPDPYLAHRSSQNFQATLASKLAEYLAAFDLVARLHVMQQVKEQTGKEVRLNTFTIAPNRPMKVALDSNVLGFESVPSQGAIDFLRRLTGMTRQAFDGLAARYRLTAFTMAGVSDVNVIEQVRQALADVLAKGGTQQDFQKAVDQILARAGIAELTAAQINTVFQSNIMRAYAKGRAEQLADPDVVAAMPFWQYRTAGDLRVRPAHAALDGFTALQSDFVWGRIYPPCGYNCRCTVIPVLASDAPDDAKLPGSMRIPFAAASVPDAGFGGFTSL